MGGRLGDAPVPWVLSAQVPVVTGALARGEVSPGWAVMPRLQEPVWETAAVLRPELLLSDSSEMSEGLRRHLEPGSLRTPLSEPPSDRSAAECFSASVWGWGIQARRRFGHREVPVHLQTKLISVCGPAVISVRTVIA